MTKLLDQAVDAARTLPIETQDEIARVVLMMAGDDQPVIQMSATEEASFADSRAQAARREFASDERMAAIWSNDL